MWEILSGAFVIAPIFPGADFPGTWGNITISGITALLLNLG